MDETPRFEFIAGSTALCFVDTLGGRAGTPVERIGTPEALAAWLAAAGLAVPNAEPDARDLEGAHRLRAAIDRAATAIARGHAPDAEAIDHINRFAARPPLRPQWSAHGRGWTAGRPVEAALSTIAADAIETLGAPDRLRECTECRMLFLDLSRAGRRRWCSSASGCGNRAKVRRHRARQAGATS